MGKEQAFEYRANKDAYTMVQAQEAWSLYQDLSQQAGLKPGLAGILDTMFYDDHPALAGRLHSDSRWLAESSHGTHIAGIISSVDPACPGIFPGVRMEARTVASKIFVPIYGYRINDDRLTKQALVSERGVNAGLRDLVFNYDKIAINCSFGYNKLTQKLLYHGVGLVNSKISLERSIRNNVLLRALDEGRDFLIVQSSGNFSYSKDFDGKYLDAYYSLHFISENPALRDRIITVGAMETEDRIWRQSQLGPLVDILAPGYKIRSAISLEEGLNPNLKGDYGQLTGTSMAAAFVTGAAAMVWSLFPQLSGPQVKAVLTRAGSSLYNRDDKRSYRVLKLADSIKYARIFATNPYLNMVKSD